MRIVRHSISFAFFASSMASVAGAAFASAPCGIPRLGSSALDRELATIVPSEAENAWMEVPWRFNIMEALTEARRVKKPMLLWVMNGNPLGCA